MVMCLSREQEIEDLRNHPAEMVTKLRTLLASGACGAPDPKRPGFYEVQSGSLVYYIHVSPVTGKILLLATWPNKPAADGVNQAA